jgi:hypothetical protein
MHITVALAQLYLVTYQQLQETQFLMELARGVRRELEVAAGAPRRVALAVLVKLKLSIGNRRNNGTEICSN